MPNLFEADSQENIVLKVRPLVRAAGKPETRDAILAHFVTLVRTARHPRAPHAAPTRCGQVRENLHIVLAVSPVGDSFRTRCRQYPSLVSCCAIDWFDRWPEDALLSVAEVCACVPARR